MAPREDGSLFPTPPPPPRPQPAYAPKSGARPPKPVTAERAQALGLGAVLNLDRFEITDEDLGQAAHTSLYGEEADVGWDQFTSAMMRSSCAFFATEVLQGPPDPPYNGKFLIAKHHLEWDQIVAEQDRICVQTPRDHGKTFFWTFAYPIWRVFYGPRTKGFIFSQTKPQAERILMDIKEELESNPKLQWLVPKKKEIWSNTHIKLSNGAHIYARGFGTKVRGAHPEWLVVDDGLNDETAYSETVRDKQKDYFFQAISNMVVPGGQLIVVGTPFHELDLYAELRENSEYYYCRFQALDEKAGKALWPERYSVEALERKKREIGSVRFNREFQCVPIADDMSLFPGYLFVGEPVEQPTVKLGMPLEWWVKEVGIQGVMIGGDFAMSASVQADYSVFWVMGLDAHENRWIMEIERHKGMGFQEQLSRLNRLGKLYQPGLVYLEANQMQRIFGDELIRTTSLPIKQFITGAQKNTLDKGVPSLRVLLENKKFRIPRGDKRSVELTDLWKNEMRAFTFHQGKLQSVGTHDDMVMAAWICDQACRMGAFSFTFGDEDEYVDPDQRPDMETLLAELTGANGNGEDFDEDAEHAANLFDDDVFTDGL